MASPARLVALALFAHGSLASSHQAPPPPYRYPRLRPTVETSPWVGLGGGALVVDAAGAALFDFRLGGDATFALTRAGDLRLGPFVELATATFASVQAVGGVELFVGAAPRPLRMFYYPGEGVFSARLGGGWAQRARELPSSPVVSLTLAYGYRAPFSLRELDDQTEPRPNQRAAARYMTGVRLYVNATVDADATAAWQLTGGIEFEPVGSFRYLLGLY